MTTTPKETQNECRPEYEMTLPTRKSSLTIVYVYTTGGIYLLRFETDQKRSMKGIGGRVSQVTVRKDDEKL